MKLLEELWVDIVQAVLDENKVPQVIIAVFIALMGITKIVFAVYA